MSNIWFTSDLHFGHEKVAGIRGFDKTEDHDYHLLRQWSKRVGEDDVVWVLGDLCLSELDYALGLVSTLPGRKHFVSGNHDAVHPMHRRAHNFQRRYLEVFESIQPFARIRVMKQSVLMSHFPYTVDRGETRYPQYRLPNLREWLLHGHTHLPDIRTGPREIHVGLDAWNLAPVQRGEIERLMKE